VSRSPRGDVPTLGQLRRQTCWVWLYCNACGRGAPTALAPPIIRWGAAASSDRLRRSARCASCGARGASLRLPSWTDTSTGMQPFPAERLAPAP
jgi:hypothetical protein